jgi:transposase
MSVLQVGIDLGRDTNAVCAVSGEGERVDQPRQFANTKPGAQEMCQWLAALMEDGAFETLHIGGEATGLLWVHLFWELQTTEALTAFQPRLYLLQARTVRHFKKVLAQRDKSDAQDAYAIAEWLRFGHLPHPVQLDERFMALQRLTRYRFHLAHTLAREKVYVQQVAFALKANTYQTQRPFSRAFAKSGLWALQHYTTIDELATGDPDELVAGLSAASRGTLVEPERYAQCLQQSAAQAYPLPPALVEPVNIMLRSSLAHITFLQHHLAVVEQHIEALAEALPGYGHLRSIRGLGLVYAAGLVAEIQDVQRFMVDAQGQLRTPHQGQAALAKFAGLWWPRIQSGKFEGQNRSLAKTGNRYLRYYLIEGANSVRCSEPAYQAYYARKYAEAVRHPHHRALVLTARKLVRLVFSLLLNDQDYQPRGGNPDY